MDRYRCRHCNELAPVMHEVKRIRGVVVHCCHCAQCGGLFGFHRPVSIAAKIALFFAEKAGKSSALST
jgi:hypothetical protein